STGGVSQTEIRKKIISQFNAIKTTTDTNAADRERDLSISILFLLDAEEDGIVNRLSSILQEIKTAMGSNDEKLKIENSDFVTVDDILFGAYVFVKKDTDKGRLEDTLLPLMNENNDEIFKDANTFISNVSTYELFKGKTGDKTDVKEITKVDGQKFDFEKSLVSTVGQLQTSGKSNVQVIRESSYLTTDKILNNQQCKEIAKFFENSLSKRKSDLVEENF